MQLPEYLRHIDRRFAEEHERQTLYLDASTRKLLVTALEQSLIAPHTDAMIAKGFEALVAEHRIDDLTRMFAQFSRVAATEKLRGAFSNYIKVRLTFAFSQKTCC
jgi:cullin-4